MKSWWLPLTTFTLATAPLAVAQDQRHWQNLADSLLIEDVDGDLQQALFEYEMLVKTLPAGDPSHSAALYRVGRVRYTLGDPTGARAALRECIRTGHHTHRSLCLDLQGQIQLEADSIHTIPEHWTFDDATHGVYHPWEYGDKGATRVRNDLRNGNSALSWTTQVDVRKGDELVIGFREPTPPPSSLQFDVEAVHLSAHLRLVFMDIHGRKYIAGTKAAEVPVGEPTTVEVHLKDVRALDNQPGTLDPSQLVRFTIQDVTAYYNRSGRNEILIDDLRIY